MYEGRSVTCTVLCRFLYVFVGQPHCFSVFGAASLTLVLLLGAIAKFRKAIIIFVMSVLLPVRIEQLDGFSLNVAFEYFIKKIC
jgi:hypothetical protein